MTPAYALGKLAACQAYGLSSVDKFTTALKDDAPQDNTPPKKEERAIIWSTPQSPGETGLAAGFGTGLGPYAGV